MSMVRAVVIGGVAVVAFVCGGSRPATAQSVKASRTCRKTIAAAFAKLATTESGIVDACHKARDKGKFVGDCNDLVQADLKGKIAKVQASATKSIGKKCIIGDPVLANYPVADPESAFFPVAADEIEGNGVDLLGSPSLQGDKAKIKCHGAISKAAVKDLAEIVKTATKCQGGVDKLADSFVELSGDCVATAVKAGPKGEAAITKACDGLAGVDVGSCDPLPTCVTTSATGTGQALAQAIYGEPIVGCGNGIVEAGEECDDGNAIDTDGCLSTCKLATCGDGFVEAGVELCGDGVGDFCSAPSPSTCQVTPCAAAGTTRSMTVRFTKPSNVTIGGLVIALDYPETQVRIPGTGGDAQVTSHVTVVPSGLVTIDDRDYEVQVSVTATPIDPGDFFHVQFDDCDAATAPTLDEFACIVRSASNDVGGDVTGQVKCSVKTP